MANSIQRQFAGQIAFAFQASLGTPASGVGILLPIKSGHAEMTMDNIPSLEIRGDGQAVRGRHGTQKTKAQYKAELQSDNFDSILEAVMRGTWAGGTLVNPPKGSLVRRYVTLEEYEQDLDQSEVYQDMVFNMISLTMKPNQMIEMDLDLVGTGQVDSRTGTGALFSTANLVNPAAVRMAALDAKVEFTDTLGTLVVLDLMSWTLKIDLKSTAPAVAASRYSPDVFDGVLAVGGSMTLMRTDLRPFADAIAETPITMSMTASTPGPTPKTLKFTIPQFTFASAVKSDFKRDGGPLEVTVPFPEALIGVDDRGGGNPPTTVIIERT